LRMSMRTARPTGTTGISCDVALVLVMQPVHGIMTAKNKAANKFFPTTDTTLFPLSADCPW